MSNHFSAGNLKFPGDGTRLDLTEEYAFRSAENPGTTVLIIDSNPAVRPPIELPPAVITSRDFHPGAVYRINVDTDGDAQADIAFTFTLRENWQGGDHSMHHPYDQAGHGRSPSAADMPSAAALPGGA
jgi:Domain of unknown function (DUF4331)